MTRRRGLFFVVLASTAAVLFSWLARAVGEAREAARAAQCMCAPKCIGLAVLNYVDKYGVYPSDILDKDGRPLLSWRVALLPFMSQEALHDAFRLDEPWDSPHNKAVLAKGTPYFVCPSFPDQDRTLTHYRGFSGPHAVFERGKVRKPGDFTDDPAATILVVETKEAVPWSKPDDLPFDPESAPGSDLLGGRHHGTFHAVFLDDSVPTFRQGLDPDLLRRMITIDGGDGPTPGEVEAARAPRR